MDSRAQLLKGVLPLAILAVIAGGDSYGYRVVQALRSAGLDSVGDASVYGTLQRLFDEGLLSSYIAESDNGPSRRYYSLTADGAQALDAGRQLWAAFTEVIAGLLDPLGGHDVVHR